MAARLASQRPGGFLFRRAAIQLGAADLLGGRFELAAGRHDVAPPWRANRRGNPGLEDDVRKAGDAIVVRTFIGRAGPGVERNEVHLGWQPVFRSEEHTSELQSLMRISYAVFCLEKK